ncbi:MAG: uracil phosphoribosyltransferase [Synergistaceae bacterium]|jgi:uracil phosphoribosyltransferase|nr:uracil phosphoribosyltransferase [Synergistaceae bacterium]
MRIVIASDHAGFALKGELREMLEGLGHDVTDVGTYSGEKPVDYPDWSEKATERITSGKADRGILICGTGIGMSIAANKVRGIYAALCDNEFSAKVSREHNDANVLVMGSRVIGVELARAITAAWLEAEPFEGRHLVRRQKIISYEVSAHGDPDRVPREGGGRVVIMEHPLIQHKLSIVRDKNTSVKDFRDLVQEIAGLMAYEISRNLPMEQIDVETPVCATKGFSLSGKKLAVVPVLRAGLGMVEGILRLVPNAKVGHVGLYRDPDTLRPVDYYCKLPNDIGERDIFILDPMLATGGSASAAIAHVKDRGGRRISLVSLIAAPEGVAKVKSDHPEVDIFSAALDSRLNDHGYIVPGLGDAGDRLFGTK